MQTTPIKQGPALALVLFYLIFDIFLALDKKAID
tara:strand:- start:2074 stop:2175 length:102 start_codon:yes stop_codon:yes gene_type:complete